MRTAVFAGTFDPFTIGHKSIVERGLQIFDRIVIAVGVNPEKMSAQSIAERCEIIGKVFANNEAVNVTSYTGLTADFVKEIGAVAILRGVRNITDFEYERNLADINKNVLGVETCFLLSLPEYSYISGSMVRELKANGYDISRFVASFR